MFPFQVLGRLCQEIVFPRAKMYELDEYDLKQQGEEIAKIESGECGHQVGSRAWLISGSKAEGFIIQNFWGQPLSDEDNMGIYGGGWCVGRRQYPRLNLSTEGTKPAYCRLQVLGDPDVLAEDMGQSRDCFGQMGAAAARRCLRRDAGSYWLSSEDMVRHIRVGGSARDASFHGPAQSYSNDSLDFIPAVVCSGPLDCMVAYGTRKRNGLWPKGKTLQRILSMPAVLAPTGHKMSSNRALEWRCSWSIPELLLADDMPRWVKQAYWTLKFTVKNRIKKLRQQRGLTETEGRSIVGSYHLKTTLMWQLERMDERYWAAQCPFTLFLAMLRSFKVNLQQEYLRGSRSYGPYMAHYFIPQCNLLEYVSRDDLKLALEVVDEILDNPLKAILMCPEFFPFVYGRETPRNEIAYTSFGLTPEKEDLEAESVAQRLLDSMVELEGAVQRSPSSFAVAKEKLDKQLRSLDEHRRMNGQSPVPLAKLSGWVCEYSDIPAPRVSPQQDPIVFINGLEDTIDWESIDSPVDRSSTVNRDSMGDRDSKVQEKGVIASVAGWIGNWFS